VDAGTKYFRIQTGRRVSATWADVYAELVEEYREGGSPRRGKVKVYEDTDDPTFVNIFITDPTDERTCVVQALFEAERFSGDRPYHQTMGALFLYGNLPIAQGLQRIFVERLNVLPELSPEKLRALGRTVLYFAHGSRQDHSLMLANVSSARAVMAATLTGWKVESSALLLENRDRVTGEEDRSDDHQVEGILYELSADDKQQLDERRAADGHVSRWVTVDTWGGLETCFIYERPPDDGSINP
jgi:hypothetical protein